MNWFAVRLLALTLCTGAVGAAETPTATAVLQAYQVAVGTVPPTGSMSIQYAWSGSGLEGRRDDIADLQTGAYVEATRADIVGEAKGFDGKIPWMRDTSGANTPQQGGDRVALFRRMSVQIDYGAHTLTITDPAHFKPVDLGTAIPFVFYDHLPMVTGLIDDYPARFDIDTGSRSEIDITSPSVSRHHLRERFPKGVHAVTGWGVGGPGRSYVIRLPTLAFNGAHGGSVRVDNPIAGLSENRGGSISDPNYDGNIGSGLLKVATFDYAHQTMYLKPATPDPRPGPESGLGIRSPQ